MPTYFDSSILLSILLNDQQSEEAAQLWASHSERVSSVLLEVESLITLRRTYAQFRAKLPKEWFSSKLERLNEYLEEVNLKYLDSVIVDRVRKEEQLSNCRTLDALHVATALLCRDTSEEVMCLCSFDDRMRKVGKNFGLLILPETL